MNISSFFIFVVVVIVSQIIGGIYLDISQKSSKDKINLTLHEHLVFSLVLGCISNSILSFIIVYFVPFKLLFLLLLNFIIIVSYYVIFPNSIKKTLFFKLKTITYNKELLKKSKKSLLFLFSIVFIILYYLNIINVNANKQNFDIFHYIHHTLDAIRNGWNSYDPDYLGKIYSTNLFSFFLLPFVSINPAIWYEIITNFLFPLQIFLFFSVIFILLSRLSKFSLTVIIITFIASLYLPSWFYFVLPSNWSILIFLMITGFLFIKELNSPLLAIYLLAYGAILHFSTLIMFGIPLILTFFIKLIENNSFQDFYINIKTNFSKGKKISILFRFTLLLIFFVIIVIGIVYFNLIELYINFSRVQPNLSISIWDYYSIGIMPIIFIYLIIILSLIIKWKFLKYQFFMIFCLIFNIYLTIYLSDVKFWSQIIHSVYLPYRFFVYHDLSFIFLAPLSIFFFSQILFEKIKLTKYSKYFGLFKNKRFSFLFYSIKNLIIRKIKGFKQYFKNKKLSFQFLFTFLNLTLILIIIPQIGINITKNYQMGQFSCYWPDGYINSLNSFNGNGSLDENTYVYMFYPNTKVSTARWDFFHTYLQDNISIDFNECNIHLDDSLYRGDLTKNMTGFSSYDFQNYLNFRNYIFNESKQISTLNANYKNYPQNFTQNQKIDYIFLDTLSNQYLIRYMLLDNQSFNQILKTSGKFVNEKYDVYIFSVNSKSGSWNRSFNEIGWKIDGNLTFNNYFQGFSNVINYSTTKIQHSTFGDNWNISSLEWNFKLNSPDYNFTRTLEARSNIGGVWKVVLKSTGFIEFHNNQFITYTNVSYPIDQFMNFKVKWTRNSIQELFLNGIKISEAIAGDLNVDFLRIVNENAGETFYIFDS